MHGDRPRRRPTHASAPFRRCAPSPPPRRRPFPSTLLRLRGRVIKTSRSESIAASRPDGPPPPPAGVAPSHVSRAGLCASMEGRDVHQSDREILDRLFTMFDRTGDDAVVRREGRGRSVFLVKLGYVF